MSVAFSTMTTALPAPFNHGSMFSEGTYPMKSNRARAAKTRNYNNCSKCKDHRQKCDISQGFPCRRCKELKYKCSLDPNSTSSPSASPEVANEMLTEENQSPISSSESLRKDTERFGEILYTGIDRLGTVKIYHVPVNTPGKVYLTVCDGEWNPKGDPQILDTKENFVKLLPRK